MITTRALVERNEKTLQMVRATADEKDAFSVQLYGVDPATVGRAVEMLVDEEVVELEQDSIEARVYRRHGDGLQSVEVRGEDAEIELQSLGISVRLAPLYADL